MSAQYLPGLDFWFHTHESRDWKLLTLGTLSTPVAECAWQSQALRFSPNSALVYGQVFQKVENYTGVFSNVCIVRYQTGTSV